jgi:Na+/melibiose symporter-like transporter
LTELEAKQQGGWILALVGIFGALTQGLFLPKLLPRFGEVNLLRFGLALTVPGLALLPYSPIWSGIVFVIALQGIGSGLTQPTLSALVSKGAPARIQGGIFGITQSLGAMSRLIGPVAANWLFARNVAWPYWAGALAVLFPLAAAWTLKATKMEVASA